MSSLSGVGRAPLARSFEAMAREKVSALEILTTIGLDAFAQGFSERLKIDAGFEASFMEGFDKIFQYIDEHSGDDAKSERAKVQIISIAGEFFSKSPKERAMAWGRPSRVGRILINLDRFCDFIPGLSTVTNLVDIFQKTFIIPFRSCVPSLNNEYHYYLKEKSIVRSFCLLIPFINMPCSIASFEDPSSGLDQGSRTLPSGITSANALYAQQQSMQAQTQMRDQEMRAQWARDQASSWARGH